MIEAEVDRRLRRLEGRFPKRSATSTEEGHVHAGGDVFKATATASLTLTTSAQSIIGNGNNANVRLLLDRGTWSVKATCDFYISAGGTDALIGRLFVNDSVTEETGGAILYDTDAVRASVTQTWRVVITTNDTPTTPNMPSSRAGRARPTTSP